jgi:hypothetical protein
MDRRRGRACGALIRLRRRRASEVRRRRPGVARRPDGAYGDYNLHVAFAEKSGAFLADVEVTIRDAKSNVVWQGISEGPMLFARLPSGRYSVAAQFNGETKRREVNVGGRPGKMHYVHWDLADLPERASAGR